MISGSEDSLFLAEKVENENGAGKSIFTLKTNSRMNIAYKGRFLREGLLEAGHRLYEPDSRKSPDTFLESLPASTDLVLWELFGGFSDLHVFSQCDMPVAVYCIDTPLNEFWLKHGLKNVNYVFVDQKQCVDSLASSGIQAAWLPLPVNNSWFQPKRDKAYDVTFVGRLTDARSKRKNLLKLLQSRYKVNIMSGLDILTTQKIFAESRIVINENFFPGLTQRVLQGLSAGSIVFTEKSPYGDDFNLKDGQEIVYYDSTDVLDRLDDLLENYDKFSAIGIRGQMKCRELYSAGRIASNLLAMTQAKENFKKDTDLTLLQWNQTVSEVLFTQRFGGNFTEQVSRLKTIAASSLEKAADAHLLLGDIQARFRGWQSAEAHYLKSLEINPASLASLKLALLLIQNNELTVAMKNIEAWKRSASGAQCGFISDIDSFQGDFRQQALANIAEIYFSLGKQWDMGFQKNFRDPVPDSAFDVAWSAWKLSPSSWSLEMMSRCLRPYGLEGELLPSMLQGIKAGIFSKPQILDIARIAYQYYDREIARRILSELKN